MHIPSYWMILENKKIWVRDSGMDTDDGQVSGVIEDNRFSVTEAWVAIIERPFWKELNSLELFVTIF